MRGVLFVCLFSIYQHAWEQSIYLFGSLTEVSLSWRILSPSNLDRPGSLYPSFYHQDLERNTCLKGKWVWFISGSRCFLSSQYTTCVTAHGCPSSHPPWSLFFFTLVSSQTHNPPVITFCPLVPVLQHLFSNLSFLMWFPK